MKMEYRNGERTGRLTWVRLGNLWLGKAAGSGGLSQPYIPSIVERGSERPGAVKGALLFRRGDSESFTARTALKSWRREGKDDTPTTAPQQFPYLSSRTRTPGGRIGIGEGKEKSCFIFVTEVY
jgi:hypothetical protein